MKSMHDLKRFSKEWWKNYWFYYRWQTVIALVVVLLVVGTVYGAVTRVEPDITICFSGNYVLSDEDHALLQERITGCISDVNHDGKTVAKFVEIPLQLDAERIEEMTAAANQQMQMQFATGDQHILVLDRELFRLYNAQGLLDTDTLYVETASSPLFEGTMLQYRDAVMVCRVKRHDYETDFTTSRQVIDAWGNPNGKEPK